MTQEPPLTREDGLILLNEFDRILPDLEAGDADEEMSEQARRMVESLPRLPLPPDVLDDQAREIGGWVELLLEGRAEEDRAGAGPVSTLLENRIRKLRTMLEADARQ